MRAYHAGSMAFSADLCCCMSEPQRQTTYRKSLHSRLGPPLHRRSWKHAGVTGLPCAPEQESSQDAGPPNNSTGCAWFWNSAYRDTRGVLF